jgi:hypothetical protein
MFVLLDLHFLFTRFSLAVWSNGAGLETTKKGATRGWT